MYRLKFIAILFAFAISCSRGLSQTSYKNVDSSSYNMYLNKEWSELTIFGEKAIKNGFDYFYLNARIGIAYFNLGKYKTSKLYLKKANKSNSYNDVVKEYLFWDNYHLLKEKEAKKWYAQLEDSTKQRINYKPKKIITSIYVEGGKKISDNNNLAKNVNYFNVALQHHLTGRIDVLHSYTYSNQSLNWGSFKQHQYYSNTSFLITKTLKFNLAIHGAQYTSQLNYFLGDFYQSPPPPGSQMPWVIFTDTVKKSGYQIRGLYQEKDILIQPRLTKNWKYFTIAPYLSIYNSKREPNYTETFNDTIIITEKNSYYMYQTTELKDSLWKPSNSFMRQIGVGINFYFNLGIITLGGDVKFINPNIKKNLFFSPFLKIDISKRIHFSTYYFNKKGYVVSLFEGAQLINTMDEIKKFSLTTQYDISKNMSLYLSYQNENILDNFNKKEYKLNSIYIGLKLKI